LLSSARDILPWREPKIALVIVTITSATALGWMLMLAPGSLGSICGSGAAAAAGIDGFLSLWLQWQVMIVTMTLPCVAPTIVAVARAERQRYGVLTAAMAFGLAYGSIASLATGAAALLHPIYLGPAGQASLVCLAIVIGLFRRRSPHRPDSGTDPVRAGLRKGIADLPSLTQMILLQLAFGLHNTPAMVLMALAMPIGMALRRRR
jgi:hypothetical protein